MTPLSVLGLINIIVTYTLYSSLFFSFRSDCIELDFKEISYLVNVYFYKIPLHLTEGFFKKSSTGQIIKFWKIFQQINLEFIKIEIIISRLVLRRDCQTSNSSFIQVKNMVILQK